MNVVVVAQQAAAFVPLTQPVQDDAQGAIGKVAAMRGVTEVASRGWRGSP
jgi:hypothetical protein